MNVYTYVEAGDIMANFRQTMQSSQFNFCGYNRTPTIVTPAEDLGIEEGEIDFNEDEDDDDE